MIEMKAGPNGPALVIQTDYMVKYVKIFLVLILTVSAVPAFSDMAPTVSVVAEELADQGYEVSRISKTFWGRVKIISRKDNLEREVILNPNTGEILRDLVRRLRQKQGSDNSGSGSQRATSGDDSDDDRDDDTSDDGDSDRDDRDESDSSGSSGSSGGSGSSDSSGSSNDSDDD